MYTRLARDMAEPSILVTLRAAQYLIDAKNAIVVSLSEGSETVPRPTD